MIRGIYTSAVGMKTQMNRMDVVSNNIANSDTVGFKRDLAVTRSFTDRLMFALGQPPSPLQFGGTRRLGEVRPGNFVDEVFTDFRGGSVRQTNNIFDIAIEGAGFITVQVAGEGAETTNRYTRAGHLSPDSAGILRTREGHAVLSSEGTPLTIPTGSGSDIEIQTNGQIVAGGEIIGTISITNFENPQTLRKFGENLFDRTEASVEADFNGRILSGYLENSNVNTVREMVEMINIQRNYEANQRLVTIQDSTLNLAVNEIARR